VDAFFYDGQSIEHLQTISTLPDNFEGAVSGADIHVSPDGKFLYVSNREDLNNIVIYSIEESTGRLSKVGEQSSGGVHPRNFMIDPTGKYLLVANRHTDNIVVFRRSSETGLLKPTGNEIEVSQPVSLQMAPVIIE
jgi:6-phosphogluconolactonase